MSIITGDFANAASKNFNTYRLGQYSITDKGGDFYSATDSAGNQVDSAVGNDGYENLCDRILARIARENNQDECRPTSRRFRNNYCDGL